MTVEITAWNKFYLQRCPQSIYISHHLQGAGHIVLAATQAAQIDNCFVDVLCFTKIE